MKFGLKRGVFPVCFALVAGMLAGCEGYNCEDRNLVRASGEGRLDAANPTFVRVLELTLTPAAFEDPNNLESYRDHFLILDFDSHAPTAGDAPQGAFDVLFTAERLDVEGLSQTTVIDFRSGPSANDLPLFDDCGPTGPCVREVQITMQLQDAATGSGDFTWTARTLGSAEWIECTDGPSLVIRDITE